MGGLAVRSLFRVGSDVRPPTLAAVLPLHARGSRALSLICFAKVEPGELVEGPRGGSPRAPPAPKPADFDITIEEDSELLGRTKLPPLKVNVNLPPKLFKSGRPLTKFRKMQVELEITLLSFVESLFNQAIGAVEQRLAAYHQAMVQSHANLQAMERRLAELIPRVERLAEENAALTRQNIELAHAANSVLQENNRL